MQQEIFLLRVPMSLAELLSLTTHSLHSMWLKALLKSSLTSLQKNLTITWTAKTLIYGFKMKPNLVNKISPPVLRLRKGHVHPVRLQQFESAYLYDAIPCMWRDQSHYCPTCKQRIYVPIFEVYFGCDGIWDLRTGHHGRRSLASTSVSRRL